ncbi:PocR ligand-binding domain-containing protein [Clostridium taeniosporum]|uniref:Histidine kinase n=1 Tax=Clostridium taeniosporum TaxID=394958 RepID=A0A1D7XK05_9CLOT|nr:PocR ligand-binding domain-containing protein [Clostridium taeniosporum]AOR23645.1 histidine kinase [Clostridium taeniosporum]
MIGNENLNSIIDVNLLKSIQDRLAEITGLAYNIVDFKGNPINNYSNFCNFCSKIRNTKDGMKICYDTNAHAGLEAAIRQKPYIFKCPAGLVDVAVPIIVKGNYLGAVFFGQVRTNKDTLKPIKKSNYYSKICRNSTELLNDFKNTKFIDYSKIESICSLVNIIVNLLGEKSELRVIQEELGFINIKLIREKQEREKLKKQIKLHELDSLETPISFEFMLNTLNTISSLAIIEDAPKTKDMIYSLTKLFRYNFKNIGNLVSLEKAIENINTYLKIQSTRFGERIKYEINIDNKINDIKIPTMFFLPFIEYSVLNGLCPKKDGGTISIKGQCYENNAIILIKDNGIGISENELFKILNGKCKQGSLGAGIYNANNVLIKYYGKDYKVNINSKLNVGTCVKFKLPI